MKRGDIRKTIIIGTGTMGYGITISLALGGHPVTICDVSDSILDKSAIIQPFNPCRHHIIIIIFQFGYPADWKSVAGAFQPGR